MAANTPSENSRISSGWPFVVGAIGTLTALGSVVFYFFLKAAEYDQHIIAMALICFALSSLSVLLFAVKVDIKAPLPLATVAFGGPAAMWVGTLLLISTLFPAPPPEISAKNVLDLLRKQELRGGDRLQGLGSLRDYVRRDESNVFRQILDTAYYIGDSARAKLTKPSIDLLFVYLSDTKALKLMQISGNNPDAADIYFKGHAGQESKTFDLLLTKNENRILQSQIGGSSDWVLVSSDPINCLIMTLYEGEGLPPEGDFIFLNTTKYTKDRIATLQLGIVSKDEIFNPEIWSLRSFPFPLPNELPVAFSKINGRWEENIEPLATGLFSWLNILNQDALMSIGGVSQNARAFINKVKEELPDTNLATLASAGVFKSRYFFSAQDVTSPLVVTLHRK